MPGSTTARGYGTEHQRERKTWTDQLATGLTVQCACNRPDCPHHHGSCPIIIDADTDWDLGHTDDRTGYLGPECGPCNRSDGARKRHRRQQMTIRQWGPTHQTTPDPVDNPHPGGPENPGATRPGLTPQRSDTPRLG